MMWDQTICCDFHFCLMLYRTSSSLDAFIWFMIISKNDFNSMYPSLNLNWLITLRPFPSKWFTLRCVRFTFANNNWFYILMSNVAFFCFAKNWWSFIMMNNSEKFNSTHYSEVLMSIHDRKPKPNHFYTKKWKNKNEHNNVFEYVCRDITNGQPLSWNGLS